MTNKLAQQKMQISPLVLSEGKSLYLYLENEFWRLKILPNIFLIYKIIDFWIYKDNKYVNNSVSQSVKC